MGSMKAKGEKETVHFPGERLLDGAQLSWQT